MQDRPTAKELLEAVQGYFQTSIAPLLTDPRVKFHGLIAMNVLEIVKRELDQGEQASREEWRSLSALLGGKAAEPVSVPDIEKALTAMNHEFERLVRSGKLDSGELRQKAFEHARKVVTGKLKVTNPAYLDEPSPEQLKRGV